MSQANTSDLLKDLFKQTSAIKLNQPAGVFGTTQNQKILQDLNKNIAELSQLVAEPADYEKVMETYEKVASGLDAAGLIGLISESEMAKYYKLADDIWASIEKDNK